jgi:hypothetical protein
MKASLTVHEGALLTHTGGYIRPLTVADTAANYIGIAAEHAVGGAADGDVYVTYFRKVEEDVPATEWEGTAPTIASVTGLVAVYAGDDSGGDANSAFYNLDGTGRIKVAEVVGMSDGHFRIRHVTALRAG